MGSDERGKTIHGYLLNEDYSLLKEAVDEFSSTINRFVSFSTSQVLRDSTLRNVVGQKSRLPMEHRLNAVELRKTIVDLREENERLKNQLLEIRSTIRYR